MIILFFFYCKLFLTNTLEKSPLTLQHALRSYPETIFGVNVLNFRLYIIEKCIVSSNI